jgi:hypothetical protein
MPFTLLHEYFGDQLTVRVGIDNELATISCARSGELAIGFPGKLVFKHHAKYVIDVLTDGRWEERTQDLPLTVEFTTPDGLPFTADHVTLDDLSRFRDLRGVPTGNWTFRVHGEKSTGVFVDDPPQTGNIRDVRGGTAFVLIAVEETVTSKSAPPLVAGTLGAFQTRRYDFDLFHLGTFVARARSRSLIGDVPTGKQLILRDPDGAVVASGAGDLNFAVTPQGIEKSRDGEGNPRKWSLEVGENIGPVSGLAVDVSATVHAQARIGTAVLQDRINAIIGERGNKVSVYCEERDSDLLVRLVILDEVSAESIDMFGLLDSRINEVAQDEGVTSDIAAHVAYNLYRQSRYFGPKVDDKEVFYVRLHDVKVSYIDISIGLSDNIQPPVPALKIDVGVEGYAIIKLRVGDLIVDIASVKIRDDHIRMEAGLRVDGNGAFVGQSWIDPEPLDVDVATYWTDQIGITVASLGIVNFVTETDVAEDIEAGLNILIWNLFRRAVEGALNRAPQVLAILLGDDFTYLELRLQGEHIELSYIAPQEPDPKPFEGYIGIIGRSALQVGPTEWQIIPPTLGNTWSAQNLAKIDHIVVVMMENRSFDHVLGYRTQIPEPDCDGLSLELTEFLSSLEFPDLGPTTFPVRKLKESDIPMNTLGKRTALPCHVGHSLTDVTDQLPAGLSIATPTGRRINSTEGFIRNFNPERANDLARENVLGYYEADDLPFFGFLADQYAYCDKYFCSHSGPTLPNRMFSISGDVQYDRSGAAILDNNKGDTFYLSRALTIFDLLNRKGIPWRVYESFPSLTMLRMYARYAGDNTNIVSIGEHASRLREDAAGPPGSFPSVVFIDPAFHHHPQNDDHPEDARTRPAVDMWRGQEFLKDVYDALVSNRELWLKTLLVITYDEHGGFYDHMLRPLAEALFQPPVMARGGMGTAVSSMTILYGVRVPTFVVSPWVPAGNRPDIVLDHCSILKTITARFLGTRRHRLFPHRQTYYTYPFLSDRVHASNSLDAYLSAAEPRLDVPASPPIEPLPLEPQLPMRGRAIITPVLSRAQMRRGNVSFHDLTGRLARQLGR